MGRCGFQLRLVDGAYEQIFTAHPEWVGKVIADLNFELPALAHGTVRGSAAAMNMSFSEGICRRISGGQRLIRR